VGVLHPDPGGGCHARLFVDFQLEHRALAGGVPQLPEKRLIRETSFSPLFPEQPGERLLDPPFPPEHHVHAGEGAQKVVLFSLEPPQEAFAGRLVEAGDPEQVAREGKGVERGMEADQVEEGLRVASLRPLAQPVPEDLLRADGRFSLPVHGAPHGEGTILYFRD
jgi:hypothetical protein